MSTSDHDFSKADEGKTVLSSDDRELGIVREVRAGAAFVEPMAGLSSKPRSRLGWSGDDRETYRLDEARVDTVTGSVVRLEEP